MRKTYEIKSRTRRLPLNISYIAGMAGVNLNGMGISETEKLERLYHQVSLRDAITLVALTGYLVCI